MTNKVLLNNVDHHALRAVPRHGAEFGDSVNQVLIFPTEFEEIQREYPIFFTRDGNANLQAIALLGLDRDENLFLDDSGWQARYVPAIQQRGPFSITLQQRDVDGELRAEPMVHVDLDDPRVGESEGQPLFLPHGGNSPYLERIAAVLRVIHQGFELSKPMFAAFERLELTRPVAVEIQLDDSKQYSMLNYHTIDEDRLAELDGAALEHLNRAGFLRLAVLAAASLGNVGRLIDLKNRKRALNG